MRLHYFHDNEYWTERHRARDSPKNNKLAVAVSQWVLVFSISVSVHDLIWTWAMEEVSNQTLIEPINRANIVA
jgi:hypothetical protein